MRLFDAGCQITYLFYLTCKSCRACCRGVKLLLIRRSWIVAKTQD